MEQPTLPTNIFAKHLLVSQKKEICSFFPAKAMFLLLFLGQRRSLNVTSQK